MRLSMRKVALAQAHEFILRAQRLGGVSTSFPKPRRSEPAGVRVDIDVIAGMAFV